MKEKDLNSIINRSFSRYGFSHKISDPMHGTGIQNPFDGFSVFYDSPWYWESKLLKGYQAFNFKKIEKHQIDNLFFIKQELDHCYSLIILGIYEPRKYFDVLFFDITCIKNLINLNKKSLLKKELLELKEQEYTFPIIRQDGKYWLQNISNISHKILYSI